MNDDELTPALDELRPFYLDLQLFAEEGDGDSDSLDEDEGDETEEEEDDDIDLGEFDLADDEDKDKKKDDDEPDYKVEAAKARARADALEERIAAERAEREKEGLRVVPGAQRSVPTQPRKRKTVDEIIGDDFDQQFISDPKTAMRKVLSEYDADREAEAQSRSVVPGASVLDNLADRFLRDQREAEPEEYALAQKAFRKLLEETPPQAKAALAMQPATVLQTTLQNSWDAAYAQGLRESRKAGKKAKSTPRGAAPPGMGGGRTSQAGGRGGAGGAQSQRFTPLERDMIARGKAGGLNAKDIKEMIQEHREEQRALRGA